jgi:urea transport system substrate-binding protein
MKDFPPSQSPARCNRREALHQSGAALTLAAASSLSPWLASGCAVPAAGAAAAPIKVGILHSQTGTMSLSETSLRDAELMAIEEINASGGLLGRQIEPVVEDPRSRAADLFPKLAKKLLVEDKVAAVFGCWTSASRKAVLPVFEQHNGLLFYPLQYEGNESSPNVVYTGSAPNQQILPAIDWLQSPAGGSLTQFFLLGSDYIFPRTANLIITRHLQLAGKAPVGELYVPLGHRDFEQVVTDIKGAVPDAIINTINGDSNVYFFKALAAARVKAKNLPVLSFSVGEDELRGLLPAWSEGHLAAWSYFQSVNTPQNRDFVRKFKDEHGADRVTDDPIEAAYSQVYLWKLAVEQAGAMDVDAVRAALRSGIEFDAPGGRLRVDPKTQHAFKWFRVGRARPDRQFDIVYESPHWIEPEPYPQCAFPGWHCDWTAGGVTKGTEVKIGS